MEYGLIGGRLGHSYSKVIHEMLCGYKYALCPLPTEEEARAFLTKRQFRAINVPSNYELQILSSLVSNVTLYGPAAEIEELSADSIVAQIDCQSLNLTVGQQTIAVSIQIPSSSRIFATGSYTVQCEVTSK